MNIKKSVMYFLVFVTVFFLCTGTYTVAGSTGNLKISPEKVSVQVGNKVKLKVTYSKKLKKIIKKKKSKLKWSSSNKKIATVDSKGVVRAKKAGKAYIRASVAGVNARCRVTVKAVSKNKSTASPKPVLINTATPTASFVPAASATPTCTCGTDVEPTATAEMSEIPDVSQTPVSVVTPQPTSEAQNADVTSTPVPSCTCNPTETPCVSSEPEYGLLPSSEKGIVVASGVVKLDGQVMTIYLLDRDYSGEMHLKFANSEYKMSGSVKENLVLLNSTYTTKTNSAGTITVSRVYPEEYWTISDLTANKTYYMKVEKKNTYDTSYSNCGALYFKGDVTSVITIY